MVAGNNNASTRAKVAGTGVWTDNQTFVMTLQYFETPHSDTITCRFDSNHMRIEFLNSMAVKSGGFKESRPVLTGSCV